MTVFSREGITKDLLERFPELTKEGAMVIVSEVFLAIERAIARGDRIVIPGFLSIKYKARARQMNLWRDRHPNAEELRMVGIIRLSDAARESIKQIPVSEEDRQHYIESRAKHRAMWDQVQSKPP
jgi:nucleoid DNA-binding protein